MKYTKIKYAVENSVAFITLNCPENLNAFNELMIDEVLHALDLCYDNSVKVVVIDSTGKNFSSGGDIKEMYDGLKEGKLVFESTVEKIAQISIKIKKLNKLVITSVKGAVAGAAFNIVLASDFCLAAEDTKFIQSFVNIGLIPDAGGIYLLTRAIGVNKTAHLVLTGEKVYVDEAIALGIVYKSFKNNDLREETNQFAFDISKGSLKAYEKIKELIYESEFRDFESFITKDIQAQLECGRTEDFQDRITKFFNRNLG